MGATNLKICMRKYRGEARDGGYAVVPLHVPYDDRNGDGVRKSSQSTQFQGQAWWQGRLTARWVIPMVVLGHEKAEPNMHGVVNDKFCGGAPLIAQPRTKMEKEWWKKLWVERQWSAKFRAEPQLLQVGSKAFNFSRIR